MSARSARRVRWSVALGTLALRALAFTWRYRVQNAEPWRALQRAHAPFVFAIWHGDLLAPTWAHRASRIRVMVSEHRDGEIIAQIIERIGFATARGSSTRGGKRALLEVIRALRDDRDIVAFTPDGPRGPRHVLQPGLILAAQRANAPIVAIGFATDRAWRAKSWDRFAIPKPFARVSIAYSDPTPVALHGTEFDAEIPRITAVLQAANAAAADALRNG